MPKPDLENAYALSSLDDTRKLYADWAETYDKTFIEASDFVQPQRVAEAFVAAGGAGPVLDFGCGTGPAPPAAINASATRCGCTKSDASIKVLS